MDGFIKRFSKYVVKIFITDILLVGLAFIISYFSKMEISDVLIYVGIFCILIGTLSMVGNGNNSANATYFMSKSVGTKSMNEVTEENFKNRNSSMRFLIFMSCVGSFLIAIVVLTDLIFK